MRLLFSLVAACTLAACATTSSPPDVLMLGEQHDAPSHRITQLEHVRRESASGRLVAVAVEMAQQGTSTAALPRDATEPQVREALRWSNEAWPWSAYGPVVMAAVRAGVPVLGANLPRDAMRSAMRDESLDGVLPRATLAAQRDAVREGHCDLLPPAQIPAMTRVQIARDQAMAETVRRAAQAGRSVILIAGAGHVDLELGVPRYLPSNLRVRSEKLPREATGRDYCAELRRELDLRPRTP